MRSDGDGIEVLHLDDDEAFLNLTRSWLERENEDIEPTTATDPERALSLLAGGAATDGGVRSEADRELESVAATGGPPAFDCVVSDYDMPGMTGLEFLERVRGRYPDLPFVLFTGKGSEEIASEAISAGVTDYLQKGTRGDRFTVLVNRIENAVDQRRAEQQAERSAQRVRQVFERITDAFVAFDRDLRFTYVNDQAADLLDADPDVLRRTHLLDAFPTIEDSKAVTACRRALEVQEPETVEVFADPLDSWLEIRAFPARDGLSVYFRDVTERKRREAELREERAFTESVLAGLPDALYAFDRTGDLLRWNDRFAATTGYTDAEIADMHPLEFVPDDETGRIADSIAAVVEDGEHVTVESAFETKSGERVPHEFTGAPLVAEDGTELGLVGIGRDIRGRREREREFEAVFNNTFQLTGLMEPDGTLVRANDPALEFVGVPPSEVVGVHLAEAPWITERNRDRVYDAVERARDGEFVRFEMEIDGTDGPAVIDFSLKPVIDDDGEVTLLIPEGRDITERKARERELERKNERLEAFTSAVSHDLKNPLSVADGSLDLYRETGREEPELVDQAADALDRMDRLIDDLLDLAEQGRVVADPEPVDLSAVVQRALTGVGSEDVEVTVEATDRTVRADEARLVQLVENLLDNAVAHAEQAARVALVDGDRLVVADDGPGVPLDERDRVFEPGYSTSSDGRGFGLAIARDIAEAHGWSLTATESRWGGARFEVEGLDGDPPGTD